MGAGGALRIASESLVPNSEGRLETVAKEAFQVSRQAALFQWYFLGQHFQVALWVPDTGSVAVTIAFASEPSHQK